MLREFILDADQRLNDYLERLDRSNAADGTTGGEARTKNLENLREICQSVLSTASR